MCVCVCSLLKNCTRKFGNILDWILHNFSRESHCHSFYSDQDPLEGSMNPIFTDFLRSSNNNEKIATKFITKIVGGQEIIMIIYEFENFSKKGGFLR